MSERIEAVKANYLDVNHSYQGSKEVVRSYFIQNLERVLRSSILSEYKGNIVINNDNGAIQCVVHHPYNLSLTIVFHSNNICTCGTQTEAQIIINNDDLYKSIQELISSAE